MDEDNVNINTSSSISVQGTGSASSGVGTISHASVSLPTVANAAHDNVSSHSEHSTMPNDSGLIGTLHIEGDPRIPGIRGPIQAV